ncbi:hypothetical protein, partial [Escherichia coli]|uniref:hypothetical protein n=1 Tax=Escherichia coli TaxID=562 RepID=UPI00202541AB
AEQKARTVLVVQDPFTSYYDAPVVADVVRLVETFGFQPVLLPFSPHAEALHTTGLPNTFAKTAKQTPEIRQPWGKLGTTTVRGVTGGGGGGVGGGEGGGGG